METGKWSSGVAFAVVVALLVTVAVQSVRLDAARERATKAALVADILEAVRDSSRVLSIEGAMLGDSLVVVQRRAIQAGQKADALDKALGLERVVRDQLQATIAGMRSRVRSDTVVVEAPGDSIRSATYDIRQEPYTLHAEVALPRAPERGRLDVRVDLDTLALELRVGCGVDNGYGVRVAEVSPPAKVPQRSPPTASCILRAPAAPLPPATATPPSSKSRRSISMPSR